MPIKDIHRLGQPRSGGPAAAADNLPALAGYTIATRSLTAACSFEPERGDAGRSSPAAGTERSFRCALPQRAAMPEFDTTTQGCRLATSVGCVLSAIADQKAGVLSARPVSYR